MLPMPLWRRSARASTTDRGRLVRPRSVAPTRELSPRGGLTEEGTRRPPAVHAGCRAPKRDTARSDGHLGVRCGRSHQSRHDTRAPDTALDDSMAGPHAPPPTRPRTTRHACTPRTAPTGSSRSTSKTCTRWSVLACMPPSVRDKHSHTIVGSHRSSKGHSLTR